MSLPPNIINQQGTVAETARQYQRTLRRFFKRPERTVDVASVADFLSINPYDNSIAHSDLPPEQRLKEMLGTVKFRRAPLPSVQDEIDVLDTLVAQSDQQNQITSRFLSLLK